MTGADLPTVLTEPAHGGEGPRSAEVSAALGVGDIDPSPRDCVLEAWPPIRDSYITGLGS